MKSARRGRLQGAAAGVAALVLLGACGRGVPAEQVSSHLPPPTGLTEEPPGGPTTSTAPAAPLTTDTTSPPPTTSTTAPATTTTTASPAAGDPCPAPAVTEFALPAGTKPGVLAATHDRSVWFTDSGTAAVGHLLPDGTVKLFPVSGGRQPAGIAVDVDGDAWFTESAWYRPDGPPDPAAAPPAIGRVTPEGAMTEFPLPTVQANPMGVPDMGSSPSAIIAGPDGAMWFVETGADQIGRITSEGLITEYPLPSRNRVHANPEGITAGPDGAVWFTDALTDRLGRIDPATGGITEFTTFPSAQRGISASVSTAVDGALWFDNINAPLIGRMTSGGTVSVVSLPDRYKPTSVVPGPDGHIWFFDQQKPAIVRLSAAGQPSDVVTVPGGPDQYVGGGALAPDPFGPLWFVEPAAAKIARLACGPAAGEKVTPGAV